MRLVVIGATVAVTVMSTSACAGGAGAVECRQGTGFYQCAGDYSESCLDTMGWAADMAVPYRAGLYPAGARGEMLSVMEEVQNACGDNGVSALIDEFPDIPTLVDIYG